MHSREDIELEIAKIKNHIRVIQNSLSQNPAPDMKEYDEISLKAQQDALKYWEQLKNRQSNLKDE